MTVLQDAPTRVRIRVRAGGRTHVLDGPVARLGRLGFHARAGGWHVFDDGLTGGLYLNGAPVRHVILPSVGTHELRVGGAEGHRVEIDVCGFPQASEASRPDEVGAASAVEVEQAAPGASLLATGDRRVETQLLSKPRLPETPTKTHPVLVARRLTVQSDTGQMLLKGVDLAAERGTLTAVVGPSGAGKSTLLRTLAGQVQPAGGGVWWEGRDLHEEYAELRSRIGVVPQEEIQHPQLGVRQSLRYSARLRLPADTTAAERDRRVDAALLQVGLTAEADRRIGSELSGGQRKRVSIATELLTTPPLLLLDEPTSGLDPGRDRSVMHHLRDLADDGRVVVVATHSVLGLDLCDTIVVLARGGRLAYSGGPSELLDHFGCTDYPELFDLLESPDFRPPPRLLAASAPPPRTRRSAIQPPRVTPGRQVTTLVGRNWALLLADRLHLAMLLLMPLVLAGLSRVVRGDDGLSLALTRGARGALSAGEANQRLTILVIAAALMGTAMSVRDLVAERSVFRREYAVGLSPGAYHASKALVFGLVCFAQGVLLTRLATLGLPAPDRDGVHGWGWWEIALPVGMLCSVMALVGLWISAMVRSTDQTMPALVAVVMSQVALCGALVQVAGRPVLEQAAWLAPGRWAYASSGVSTRLSRVGADGDDPLLEFSTQQWWLDMGGLSLLGLIAFWAGSRVVRRVGSEHS